jgi:hypothetical protein
MPTSTLNLGKVKGDAATITIKQVNTVSPTSNATVVNDGTTDDVQLVFGIPQGIQGLTGPIGPIGPIGPSIESLVINETGTARTLALSDVNQYIRCTNVSQIDITIPAEPAVSWPVGAVIYFRRVAGAISIAGDIGVTLTGSSASILANQNFAIKRVGANSWDLI